MSDIIENRNAALFNTITILSQIDDTFDEFPDKKKYFRDLFLDRVAQTWANDSIDIFNMSNKIRALKQYTNKDILFKFKLAECINYIKCITTDDVTIPLFSLN